MIVDNAVPATIYDASRRHPTEPDRRAGCLHALFGDAARRVTRCSSSSRTTTLVSWDNRHLIEYTRGAGYRDTLRYEHRRAASEQLLAVPDAIAWCWAKYGDWRRRIAPVVTDVRTV